MSAGVVSTMKDWKRSKLLRQPTKNYEKNYPFIRKYKEASEKEKMEVENE
jgi:hypothetical protein